MLFKRINEVESTATAFWINAALFMTLYAQLQTVSSAPLPSSLSFYEKLYINASSQNCFLLPKVIEANNNYTRSKINHLCDSNAAVKDVNLSKEKVSYASICDSLTYIFPVLCQIKNISRNVNVSTTVDVMKIGDIGIQKLCTNLREITSNISRLSGGKMISFLTEVSSAHSDSNRNNNDDDKPCLSMCKNSRATREGFNEYANLDVHPACIILFKGYTIYQQVLVGNRDSSISKGVPGIKSVSDEASKKSPENTVQNDPRAKESVSKTVSPAVSIAKVPAVEETTLQDPNKDTIVEATSPTLSSTEAKKSKPAKGNGNQEVPEKPIETATKLSGLENDKSTEINSESLKKTKEQQKSITNAKVSSSTSTTAVALDARPNDEPVPPPLKNVNKVQISTAVPREKEDTANIIDSANEKATETVRKTFSVADKNQIGDDRDKINISAEQKKQPPKQSKQKTDTDALTVEVQDLDGMDDNYNAEEDLDKPPIDVGEKEIPQPEIQNRGSSSGTPFKPKKEFLGNTFREDIDFSRGTTINVSYKDSEDTGFFSYFLFCVTLVGLVYLVIHNKKKLIAFVVEGKRPRSRNRRSSSSSQYRRLENNFD